MRVVAVTACTTGIAHTYMAAEKLTKAAKGLGFDIKVETQGALGVENIISQKEIDNADLAILAIDIEIEGKQRFNNIATVSVGVEDAIRSPGNCFKDSKSL